MSTKRNLATLLLLMSATLVLGTGCASEGPNIGFMAYPIPVSPYFMKDRENQFYKHERYDRVPVLPPLVAGGPTAALDEPSDDQVMRKLEEAHPLEGGLPYLQEYQRNNVRIVKEKISDYIDPPRVYPLIGPAQLHHSHWKCTVYYSEITRPGWPLPHTLRDVDAVEVIYIDKDHFHMVGNVDPSTTSPPTGG